MSNETEDRSPRFNRATLIRIFAVLAFVVLGTFAVVQTMMSDKTPKEDNQTTQKENGGDEESPQSSGADSADSQADKTDNNSTDHSAPAGAGLPPSPGFGNFNRSFGGKPDFTQTSPANSFGSSTKGAGAAAPKFADALKNKPDSGTDKKNDFAFKPPTSKGLPPITKTQPIKTSRAPIVQSFDDLSASPAAAQQKPPERTASLENPDDLEANPGKAGVPSRFQSLVADKPDAPDPQKSAFPDPAAKSTTPAKIISNLKSDPVEKPQIVTDSARQTNSKFGALQALQPQKNPSAAGQLANDDPLATTNKTTGVSFGSGSDVKPLRPQNEFSASPKSFSGQPLVNRDQSSRTTPASQKPIAETKPQLNSTTPRPPLGLPGANGVKPDNPQTFNPQDLPIRNRGIANNQQSNALLDGRTRQLPQSHKGGLSFPPPAQQNQVPLRNASSSRLATPAAPVPAAPTGTFATPGDRQLEGAQAPSLTVEKIAPREIQLNQPADFQIVVRNTGRVPANQVQVFDQIPQGTQLLQADPQPQREPNGLVRWNLGTIRPGQEKRVKLQLRPNRTGEIGSVAHVTFATQASMRTLVTKPVLTIRHTGPPKVLIGDNVTLEIVVENRGDGPANGVIIQEDVPEQLAFPNGFRELEYEIGTLAPGQSRKINLSLKAVKSGRLRNVLFASADGGLKEQHSIEMEVVAPQLVTAGSGPSRRYLRRQATHSFSVENRGTANATNVELTARLPRGLRFVAANNRGQYDSNAHAVYWSLAELTPGVAANVELTTMPIEAGDQAIDFDASADLDQKSKTSKRLLVEHLIDVFFDIDDQVDPIEIGSSTNYQVRLVNQGTKVATNVRVQIDFPPGISPTGVQGNLPNEIRGQQVFFAPISSLNPGQELKFTVAAKGVTAGDHRIALRLQTDGRETPVAKEETTRVYNDR